MILNNFIDCIKRLFNFKHLQYIHFTVTQSVKYIFNYIYRDSPDIRSAAVKQTDRRIIVAGLCIDPDQPKLTKM